MKILTGIAATLTLSLCFTACQEDAKKSSPSPAVPTPGPATTASQKPELFLYAVNVENLRLRDQPGQTAGVVGQLKECEIVEGTGEKSQNQDEVELRGISIKAPYFRISSAAGANGWAFGGALTSLYAGTRAGSPDKQPLIALARFLKSLNVKTLESGGKAWSFVEQQFASSNGALADGAYLLLNRFFRRMEQEGAFYNMTEGKPWSDKVMDAIYQGKFDPQSNPTTKLLVANGFRVVAAEGSVFPVVDESRFHAFFASKTTAGMKDYLNQNMAEQNKPMYDDGGVIIPMEEVADQAIFWENFNRNYPYFQLHDEALHSEEWLRLLLVNGSDNTPVFNYESDGINEDFKKMWAYVLQKYPKSQVAQLVKQMADLCAAENWKRTKKVEAFQLELVNKLQYNGY